MVEYGFVSGLKFDAGYKKELEEGVLTVWQDRKNDLNKENIGLENKIIGLRTKMDEIYNKLKSTSSELILQRLESEYGELNQRLQEITNERNTFEKTELDSTMLIKYIRFVMEHPARIITDATDSRERGVYFGSLFEELPTYTELLNGTPKLKRIFNLEPSVVKDKNLLVTPGRIELPFTG